MAGEVWREASSIFTHKSSTEQILTASVCKNSTDSGLHLASSERKSLWEGLSPVESTFLTFVWPFAHIYNPCGCLF
jgi:hypothetical protein